MVMRQIHPTVLLLLQFLPFSEPTVNLAVKTSQGEDRVAQVFMLRHSCASLVTKHNGKNGKNAGFRRKLEMCRITEEKKKKISPNWHVLKCRFFKRQLANQKEKIRTVASVIAENYSPQNDVTDVNPSL